MENKQPLKKMMTEEEFKEYMRNSINLQDFTCVSRVRSVVRAFKRGHITKFGMIIPNKPFNNRKNTSSRKGVHSRATNEMKKKLYKTTLNYYKYGKGREKLASPEQ